MSKVTEEELVQKATGKRVTLDALKANIAEEHYFRAHDATGQAEDHPLGCLTFCILVLKNGYTVVGQSACADPTNYNKDIGERLAREDAEKKIWPLMGYNLKQELYLTQGDGSDFKGRVRKEERELADKIGKLEKFVTGQAQTTLDAKTLRDLEDQLDAMLTYHEVLLKRIAQF